MKNEGEFNGVLQATSWGQNMVVMTKRKMNPFSIHESSIVESSSKCLGKPAKVTLVPVLNQYSMWNIKKCRRLAVGSSIVDSKNTNMTTAN